MSEPAVSVVVPAYNAAATLPATLEALAVQDLAEPYEVIVVDNGSDDRTGEVAAQAPGPVSVIRKPPGRAGSARNRGAEAARAPAVAFTDADCRPTPGWLREGLAALRDADLVQGAVRPDPRDPLGPFDRTVWVVGPAGLYETANLFCDRELLRRIGGFEDRIPARLSAPFGEDAWLGARAARAGARTAFCEQALVHHAVFPRGPHGYVAERLRSRHFPALVAEIPELRDQLLVGRLFLSRRSTALDAAVCGLGVAIASRSALPLLAAVPYAWIAGRRAARWGRRQGPLVAGVDLAADAVSLGALAWGSLRARSLVL